MKYLSKLLSMLLVGAMLYSTGCTDYVHDINNVNNRVDQEVATLTGALQKAIDDAKEANDALKAEIDALEEQLTGVETELTGVKSELDQAKKDLADLQSKAATKEELAALESKVATKTELAEQLAALKTELESKIGGVEARVKANEDAIATLQSFVNGFNGDLATAGYENFAQVLAALNTLKANYDQHLLDFDNYKAEAAKDLADAVAALETAIDTAVAELKAELVEKIETADALLQDQIDELVKDLTAAVEDITELQADMTAVEGRLDGAEKAIQDNAGLIATAQEDIKDLQDADKDLQDQIDATNAAIETAKTEVVALLTTEIGKLQGQIDETKAALDTLTQNFNTLRAEYDKFVAEVNTKLAALTANVEGLLNRIQSVVYVPEYTDGKITVKNVTFGNGNDIYKVLCGYAKVQYDIYPAYAAEALATSYEKGMLSFNHEELKTRAAHEFDILAVNYKGNGRVELEVLLHNFDLATENVAVSLVVNAPEGDKTASNLSSCYAQLYASDEVAYNVSMNLYDAEMVVINGKEYNEQKPYDDEAFIAEGGYSYRPFEGYSLGFVLSNDNTNTVWSYEALKAVYPNLPMPEYTGDHKDTITFERVEGKEFSLDGLKGIEEVANEPGINVSKNDKQYIGVSSAFGISYNWNGYEVAANAKFEILPGSSDNVIYELTDPFKFMWDYTLDASVDASLIGPFAATIDDLKYTRTDKAIKASDLVKTSEDTELPVDVTLDEVLASTPLSVVVDVEGVEANVSGLNSGNLSFSFTGFAWDKEYVVSATYGMTHIDETFDSTVTVKFYVNTVDRSHDAITFGPYEHAGDVYRTNFVETYTDEFSFAGYEENFRGKEAEAFAFDVLKTHEYVVTANTVNGADVQADTDSIVLDICDYDEIATKYHYDNELAKDENDNIVMDFNYAKSINLWYGQVVNFSSEVSFVQPKTWFVKVPQYVYPVSTGFASDVQPYFFPDRSKEAALSSFNVEKVDLNAAFDLLYCGKHETIPVSGDRQNFEFSGDKLSLEFAFEGELEDPFVAYDSTYPYNFTGKGLLMYNNYISYYATDKQVEVGANVYLYNEDGAKLKLATNFDSGVVLDEGIEDYSAYIVKQYNPINPGTAIQHDPEYVYEQKDYYFDLAEYFSLQDKRLVELINHVDRLDENGKILVENFLVYGNDANGFANNYYAGDIYGYKPTDEFGVAVAGIIPVKVKFEFTGSDAEQLLAKNLLYPVADSGIVKFSYTSEVDLKKDIVINVTMTVETAWHKGEPTTNKIVIKNGYLAQ